MLGQIIMIVVAIIATVLTAGALSGLASSTVSLWTAGTTAIGMGTGGALGLAGAAGVGSLGAAGFAVSAAVGSIASQLVGNAIGAVDGFSWKSVALAALGGGISAALPGEVFGFAKGSLPNAVAKAMIGNATTQGIAVATGLQDKFSWVNVAAAGVGAGVGYGLNQALFGEKLPDGIQGPVRPGLLNSFDPFEKFVGMGLTGFGAGLATAVARGGRINVTQVAVDSFGNLLGESIVEAAAAVRPTVAKPTLSKEDVLAMGDDASAMLEMAASKHGGFDKIPVEVLNKVYAKASSVHVALEQLAAAGQIQNPSADNPVVLVAAQGFSPGEVIEAGVTQLARNGAFNVGVVGGTLEFVGKFVQGAGALMRDVLLAQQYVALGMDSKLNQGLWQFDERKAAWNNLNDLVDAGRQILKDPNRYIGDQIGTTVDRVNAARLQAESGGLSDWVLYGREVGNASMAVVTTVGGAFGAARMATAGLAGLRTAVRTRINELAPDVRGNGFLNDQALSRGSPVRVPGENGGTVAAATPVTSGGTANPATGAALKDDLARVAKPEPNVTVLPDGTRRYSYGSVKQGQGLDASVDTSGVLRLEVRSGARRQQYGSGAEMFDDMMSAMNKNGQVKEILGQWSNTPGLTSNFDAMLSNMKAGMTRQQAAINTWTGQQAARYGFTNADVTGNATSGFRVTFTKGPK